MGFYKDFFNKLFIIKSQHYSVQVCCSPQIIYYGSNKKAISFVCVEVLSFLALLLPNLGERVNGKSVLNILTFLLLVSLFHAWMAKMTIAFKET